MEGTSLGSPPSLEFQVADPEVPRHRLTGVGLKNVTRRNGDREARVPVWTTTAGLVLNSNPIAGMFVADLTEEQRADVRAVLGGMLRERSEGSGGAARDLNCHARRGLENR